MSGFWIYCVYIVLYLYSEKRGINMIIHCVTNADCTRAPEPQHLETSIHHELLDYHIAVTWISLRILLLLCDTNSIYCVNTMNAFKEGLSESVHRYPHFQSVESKYFLSSSVSSTSTVFNCNSSYLYFGIYVFIWSCCQFL